MKRKGKKEPKAPKSKTNPTKLSKDEQAKRDNNKELISFKGGGNTRISKKIGGQKQEKEITVSS